MSPRKSLGMFKQGSGVGRGPRGLLKNLNMVDSVLTPHKLTLEEAMHLELGLPTSTRKPLGMS